MGLTKQRNEVQPPRSPDAEASLGPIDLTFQTGRLTVLIGPNGAGKSTLMRIAAGIVTPTAGEVNIGGAALRTIARTSLAKQLAFVPQSFSPVFPFRVSELVLMGRHAKLGFARTERADDLAIAKHAMEETDVWHLRDRRFDTLSGGEARRVLLAQAFAQEAAAWLLDEPTSALDPAHANAIFRSLAAERQRGRTIVVVSHDLHLTVRYADEVLVMAHGAVVARGTPREILTSPETTAAFGVPIHVGVLPGGALFAVPE